MSDDNHRPESGADLNQVASQLNEGLRSCRSLLANYRAVLAGQADDFGLAEGRDGIANRGDSIGNDPRVN